MKSIKLFFQTKVQSDSDLLAFENRVNEYLNSLKATLGPHPDGFVDVQFQVSSSTAEYSDILAIVTSEDPNEK